MFIPRKQGFIYASYRIYKSNVKDEDGIVTLSVRKTCTAAFSIW